MIKPVKSKVISLKALILMVLVTSWLEILPQNYRADTARINKIVNEISMDFYSDLGRTKKLLDNLGKELSKVNHPAAKSAYFNYLGSLGWFDGNLDSALFYYRKSLVEAKKASDKRRIMLALGNLGMIFNNIDMPDSAIKYLYESLSIAIKLKNDKVIGKNSLDISNYYIDLFDYDNALKFNKIADSLAIISKDTMLMMYTKINFGIIYDNINQVELSLENYHKALRLQAVNKKIYILPQIYMNIGLYYMRQRSMDSAKVYFAKSLDNLDAYNNMAMYNNILINFGALYYELGNMKLSKEYFEKIIEGSPLKFLSGKHVNLAKIFLRLKDFDSAYYHVEKGINYAKDANHKTFLINGLEVKASIDTASGNLAGAISSLLEVIALKDEIWSDKLGQTVANLMSESKYYNLMEENKNLESINSSIKKSIQRQRIINLLLALLALLIGFLLYIYLKFNKKLKNKNTELVQNQQMLSETNEKLEQANLVLDSQNELKSTLISIISHDIKSPIGSVSQILNLMNQKTSSLSIDEKTRLIDSAIKSLNNSYHTLDNLLAWTGMLLTEKGSDFAEIKLRELIRFNVDLLLDTAKAKKISLEVDCPADASIVHSENFISLVLRNFISNSIKFCSTNGHVKVQVEKTPDGIKVSVIDDGIGITSPNIKYIFNKYSNFTTMGTNKEKGNGLGLRLVKELADYYGVEVDFQSIPTQRTQFYLLFKHSITG